MAVSSELLELLTAGKVEGKHWSFNFRQRLPRFHGCAFSNVDLFYHTVLWCFQFVLHLHGFNHDHALPSFYLGSYPRKNTYHLAWHGRSNFFYALFRSTGSPARTKRTRIAH